MQDADKRQLLAMPRHEGEVVGEGVNVAARIRELSRPGGICVSDGVYAEVRNKPGIAAQPLGTPELGNVSRPIPVRTLEAEGTESGQEARLAATRHRCPQRAGIPGR